MTTRDERLAELEAEREEIEEGLANIKGQLERAAAIRSETGEKADADWYNRAKHAQRMRGIDHQSILREIAAIRREQRAEEFKSSDGFFRKAAKELLKPAQFQMIQERAMELANES